MMVGEWKPVNSNDILKALFNEKYGLKKDIKMTPGYTEKVCVNIFKSQVEAYIVVPKDEVIFEGLLKNYD